MSLAPSATDPQIIKTLEKAYLEIRRLKEDLARLRADRAEPIALIGIGCRFPGGVIDAETYWSLLHAGRDAIREVPEGRWDVDACYDPDPEAPGKAYCRKGGFLDHVDEFDCQFFGIAPREAAEMDPQQRLLLEVAWEAVEDTGHAADSLRGSRTGVYVGMCMDDYSERTIHGPDLGRINPYSSLGNSRSIAVGRIAYVLDLSGPVLQLDTTCSSSLLAIHLGCRALASRECDLALAGGVNLILSPSSMVGFSKLRALSPEGYCRTFDARANGYARGEGCGMVVLKRLGDALADGDRIIAVVPGSGANHDGRSNGLTAPNGLAQERLITQVLRDAGLQPRDVQYVEAHGTGTQLGDPIEVQALGRTLGVGRDGDRLWIGSVKTNFGHLEAAAGVAGFIKAALCVERGELVPSLHFETPNPHVAWADLAVDVNTRVRPWPAAAGPRRAGVSAFGMSGTNVHIVLEQSSVRSPAPSLPAGAPHAFLLSADSPTALRDMAGRLRQHLDDHNLPVGDVAYTLTAGRSLRPHRAGFVAADRAEAMRALAGVAESDVGPPVAGAEPPVAFLFTGQGSQYVGAGQELFAVHPVFRSALEACHEALAPYLERPILEVLFSPPGAPGAQDIHDTRYTQPALFALQVGLGTLLAAYGVRPTAVLGHSVGEIAASCVAGVLDLESAARLVATRARLMSELPREGAMLAVEIEPAEAPVLLARLQNERVVLAAINGARQVVFSGPRDGIDELALICADRMRASRLEVSHAFHSPLMQPMLAPFAREAAKLHYRPPTCAFFSTVTGQLERDRIANAGYWVEQVRAPVRFSEAARNLLGAHRGVWLELGPKPHLLGLCRDVIGQLRAGLPTLKGSTGQRRSVLESLTRMTLLGVRVDWARGERPFLHRRVALPSYPFERRRFRIEPAEHGGAARSASGAAQSTRPVFPGGATAVADGTRFALDVASNTFDFLGQHLIHGRTVLPGACHVALIAASAETVLGGHACEIVDLVFPRAMVVEPGRSRRVHTCFTRGAEDGGFALEIESEEAASVGEAVASVPPDVHATARVRRLPEASVPAHASVAELRARCSEAFDPETLFAAQAARGIALGPCFRWLESAWRGPDSALARIRAPAQLQPLPGAEFHPALIDAAFQLLGATTDLDRRLAYIPWRIERVRIHARGVPAGSWCHARRHGAGAEATARLVGDVTLVSDTGALLLELVGVEARVVEAEDLAAERLPIHEWTWQSRPLTGPSGDVPGAVIVLGDPGGLGATLVARLPPAACAVLVTPGPVWRERGPGHLEAPTAAADDGSQLWSRIEAYSGPVASVVDLSSLETSRELPGATDGPANATLDDRSFDRESRAVLGPAWAAARHLAVRRGARLLLVTRGAVATEPEANVSPMMAALWSFGASLSSELTTLDCRRIDLDPRGGVAAEGDADVLLTELGARAVDAGGGDAAAEAGVAAIRGSVRCIPQLVQARPAIAPVRLRANGTYVVTGGTGALGLHVAGWLVERGGREVVLTCRPGTTLGEEQERVLAELRRAGARVRVEPVDLAHATEVQAFWDRLARSGPAVCGIVHAAGTIRDQPFEQMTWHDFRAVFNVKAGAALWLDQASRGQALDCFVGFSSIAAALGSSGQSGYAAANGFLDGVVANRRACGERAHSIQWGPWARIGMAARLAAPARQRIEARGLGWIEPREASAVLDGIWQARRASTLVVRASWNALAAQLAPAVARTIAPLGRRAPTTPVGTMAAALARISSPSARAAQLTALVRAEVAHRLGCDPTEIPVDRPLADLGLDSLMAVELRNALSHGLAIDVPMARLMEYPTIEALASVLASLLDSAGESVSVGDAVLRTGQPGGPVLVWVHAVDGELDPYSELARQFPLDFAVFGLRAPGLRVGAAAHPDTLEALAASHLRHLLAAPPRGPIHLGGWSLGGVIALTLAEQLERHGVRVASLVLMDSYAPFDLPEAARQDEHSLASLAADLGAILGTPLLVDPAQLARIAPQRREESIMQRALEAGLLPREAGRRAAFVANLAAMLRHTPAIHVRKVTVISADSPVVTTNTDTSRRWCRWLPTATFHTAPGDHRSILRGPGAIRIAQIVRELVAEDGGALDPPPAVPSPLSSSNLGMSVTAGPTGEPEHAQ